MTNWIVDYLEDWNREDVDAVLSWFTDDAVYEDTTIKHGADGKDQLRRFVSTSFEKFPGMTFEFVHGVEDEHGFAMSWVMQPIGLRGASIGLLRDGKISEQRDYWDGTFFEAPTL